MTKTEIAKAYIEARSKELPLKKILVSKELMSFDPVNFPKLDATRKVVDCAFSELELVTEKYSCEKPIADTDYATQIYRKEEQDKKIRQIHPLFEKIIERYTEAELKDIADGHSSKPIVRAANIEFRGLRFKWMQISDTHLGSKHTNPADIVAAFKHAEEEGCQMIAHVGDVFEGMSGREGHIYELSEIGYAAQLELGRQVFSETKLPVNAISGNHDEWFIKSNGAYIVKELCDRLPHLNYLGQNYGTIYLNGARYELTHGLDGGGSYAISYRVQKIIEAYEGGQKPQIIGTGHDHKAGYFFLRNVHAFLGGCMQNQSDWMRQTRKAAMKGYWIIDALIDDGEVKTIKMQFTPFYR
jgi:UDP-2,3-diacylglucosamine pyrophosphatase LpxH